MKEKFKVTLIVSREEGDRHPSRWDWSDLVGEETEVLSVEEIEDETVGRKSAAKQDVQGKSEKIRIVVAPVGEAPFETVIDNTLEAMQFLVGGYIEPIRVGDLDVWINEEGLIMNLPYNRTVEGYPITGTIFVAASNEEGDTLGLNDDQTKRAIRLLSKPEPARWSLP